MIKHLLLSLSLCAVAGTSCMAQNNFTITGETVGLPDKQKLYLVDPTGQVPRIADSTVTQNSHFAFKGTQETPALYFVSIADNEGHQRPLTDFILEKGNINMVCGEPFEKQHAVGTPLNDAYQLFKDSANYYRSQMNTLLNAGNETGYQQASQARMNMISKTISNNLDNMLGQMLLLNYADKFPIAQQSAWIALIPEGKRNKSLSDAIAELQDRIKRKENSAEGKILPDITLNDTTGVPHTLSSIYKKSPYTIIDFWASWCGPCRHEMPNVKRVYETYHPKGLQIIGVSFDRYKDRWVDAIKSLGLPWPQLSDLKDWHSIASQTYGISSIPATIIVDSNGKVIARDLRGEELEQKIKSLFDK